METVRGIEYGKVVSGIRHVKDDEVVLPLKPVIRIATDKDQKQVEENQKAAKSAMGVCLEEQTKSWTGNETRGRRVYL